MTDAWSVMDISTVVMAAAAVATAAIVFRQLRLIRLTLGVGSMLRLDEAWESLSSTRRYAAKQLLDRAPGSDVDKILDFFDTIALLTRRKVLDEELAWPTFYWPAANYWSASQDYVRTVQRAEGGATWQDLQRLIPRLQATEARKSTRPQAEISPSEEQTKTFLNEEANIQPPFSE
jgi:hypothetical protein